jgi:uncharacterized membrane protein YkoI
MKTSSAFGAVAFFLALAAPVFAQGPFPGMKLAREAKVSLVQARAIALRAVPGKIVTQELERERGGSGLRYTFDIKTGAKTREVGVDARTGRVLENIVEGKDRD